MPQLNFPKNSLIYSAVLLRLFFAVFFYHPDLKSQFYHAGFLKEGIVNIYDFLALRRSTLPYSDTFNYPPLTYFALGGWHIAASLITGPGLDLWLSDWSDRHLFNPDLFTYILVLKLPYLLADLLILKLLLTLVDPKFTHRLSLLWLFNPVSLYAVYMIGQFDILPALLTVWSLLLVTKNRLAPAAFVLGLGAALKTYPLLLVPFIIFRSRSPSRMLAVGLSAVSGWLIPMLPFFSTPSFVQSVFQSSLAGRIFTTPYFLLFYLLLLGFSFRDRFRLDLTPEFMGTTLAVLMFSRFHAQWAVWTLPFVMLTQARRPRLNIFASFFALAFFALIFLIPDQYLSVGLFTPLIPYLTTIPPLAAQLPQLPFDLLFRGLLLFSGFWLVLSTFTHASQNS